MLKRLREAGISVHEYCFMATLTWILLDDHAALLAAVASAVALRKGPARESLFTNLRLFANTLEGGQAKVASLYEWVVDNDGSPISCRLVLKRTDPDYWKAMSNWYGRADPDVFVKRHPELKDLRQTVSRKVGEAPKSYPLV